MKITLNPVTNGNMLSTINANFDRLKEELQNRVLYRDNPSDEPNETITDLDMNGRRIINLPPPVNLNEAARLQDVQDAIAGETTASLVAFVPTGDIASTTVQGAIVEVDAEHHGLETAFNAHLTDLIDAHDASAISLSAVPTISATNVQTAIEELVAEKQKVFALTTYAYLAILTIDASVADIAVTDANSAIAVTVNTPISPTIAQRLTITVRNVSGGALGVLSWGPVFKLAAWAQPANGFSRSITFYYNGTNWIEMNRTTVDIPN